MTESETKRLAAMLAEAFLERLAPLIVEHAALRAELDAVMARLAEVEPRLE